MSPEQQQSLLLPLEFSPRKTRGSSKRAFEEVQSKTHSSDNCESNSDIIRASQRSTNATRQTKKKPRTKLNACWKCKLLKKQCDDESSCRECIKSDDWTWEFGCTREELSGRIKDIVPNLPGLGSNEWLLPAAGDINLKIRMVYEKPDIEIQDLDIFAGWADDRSKASRALVAFLKQFHNLNTRWGNYYEPLTEALVTLCAEIQEGIVKKHRLDRKPMSEASLLIASALRALALGYYISEVEGWLINGTEESFIQSMFLEPTTISEFGNISVIVSRHNPTKDDLGSADGAKLSSMLRDIIQTTQTLILCGKASDWPVIFCVLCLLKMIHQSVGSSLIPYIKFPLDCYSKYLNVWETLCQLFDAASDGHNPLVDDWDKSEYETLVGNDSLALDHFRKLNVLWIESGFEEYGDDDDLIARTDRFVAGCEI